MCCYVTPQITRNLLETIFMFTADVYNTIKIIDVIRSLVNQGMDFIN